MRGISSKVTRGLPTQARIQCVDNTGAKVVQLISVLNTGGVLEDTLLVVLAIWFVSL